MQSSILHLTCSCLRNNNNSVIVWKLLFPPQRSGGSSGNVDKVVTDRSQTLRDGAELGLYTFLGFAFQAIGLETTTASRSAFLLYLNVKIVPFLAAALYRREIPLATWLSALLALTGTCLLSTDGGMPNAGDAWCVAAAVASALFILRLETFSARCDAAQLNATSFATGTPQLYDAYDCSYTC